MSNSLYQQALQHIPAGVNSPVRAFGAVDGNPVFFKKGKGAHLFSSENKAYIDYVGSWGPMILGHAHDEVIKIVKETASNGLSFGAPNELEVKLANNICNIMPSIEKIRMVNSGTEATMSAIRLARGFTQKNKIIKFEGCYHGHADFLLVKAGSGALTFGQPSSAGVTPGCVQDTLVAQFNDLNSVEQLFKDNPDEIACIILEPIAGNMNFIKPQNNFLQGLRELCDKYHSLLIFDEVMTGFRVALGGAQSLYDIKPDLTTLGKVIGGGMPVGAFGGRADIMDYIAPCGPVYQAGTLSGNPVAMAAGLKTLALISSNGFFEKLETKTKTLVNRLQKKADHHNIAFYTDYAGGMFGFFFTEENPITNFQQVMQCDTAIFKTFFHSMLEQGIYLAPSAFEAGFMSIAHSDEDINQTIDAADKAFATLKLKEKIS